MNEKQQMQTAIKNGGMPAYKNLKLIYDYTPEPTRHIINTMIDKQAKEDLEKIVDALSLIQNYEQAGVKFNFLKYQT